MGNPKLARYALISLIGISIIYIIPFIFAQSNFDIDLLNLQSGILNNKGFIISLKNTIVFMVIFVPVIVIVGFILAYITEKMNYGIIVKAAIVLPVTMPVLSVAGFFRDNMEILFENFNGIFVIGLVFIWSCLGFTYLVFLISLSNRNRSIEEAASLDGAGTFKTLFHVIMPTHIEALILSTILSIYNSLKIFKQTYAMFGEYPKYDMFMIQNFLYLRLKRLELSSLIVTADVFLIFILAVLIAIVIFGNMQRRKLLK